MSKTMCVFSILNLRGRESLEIAVRILSQNLELKLKTEPSWFQLPSGVIVTYSKLER